MTIASLWQEATLQHADRLAVGWVGDTPWTYHEVDLRIRSLQAYWLSQGLKAGSKVALWAGNQPLWCVAYLAVTTGPWTVVPLLPEFTPLDTAKALAHGEVELLIVGRILGESWSQWLPEAPAQLRPFLDKLQVIPLDDLEVLPRRREAIPEPLESDLAALIYTSGTTGNPKGVMLSQGNITSNVVSAAPLAQLTAGDCMLSILPLAHTFECSLGLLVPLSLGVAVYYLKKPASAAVLLPALDLVRPHAMISVPLFIEKIYRQRIAPQLNSGLLGLLQRVPLVGWLLARIAGAKLHKIFGGRLKFFGIGGAPLAPPVDRFLRRSGFPYAIGYGLTETSPLVAGHLKEVLYSTGRPLKGVEVRVAHPEHEQGAGEIQVRGPNVMLGYYKDPERTAEVMTGDGWFRTGDLGAFDLHHQLHILGRSKNVLLGPSGENIYPEAIEALINQDRMIVESLVVQRGHELVARVVVNTENLAEHLRHWAEHKGHAVALWSEDSTKALEAYLMELRVHINRQLARFSRVTSVVVEPVPFEKTATLKIKRFLYS